MQNTKWIVLVIAAAFGFGCGVSTPSTAEKRLAVADTGGAIEVAYAGSYQFFPDRTTLGQTGTFSLNIDRLEADVSGTVTLSGPLSATGDLKAKRTGSRLIGTIAFQFGSVDVKATISDAEIDGSLRSKALGLTGTFSGHPASQGGGPSPSPTGCSTNADCGPNRVCIFPPCSPEATSCQGSCYPPSSPVSDGGIAPSPLPSPCGAACQADSDCTGPIVAVAELCADGTSDGFHWYCEQGSCQAEACKNDGGPATSR